MGDLDWKARVLEAGRAVGRHATAGMQRKGGQHLSGGGEEMM